MGKGHQGHEVCGTAHHHPSTEDVNACSSFSMQHIGAFSTTTATVVAVAAPITPKEKMGRRRTPAERPRAVAAHGDLGGAVHEERSRFSSSASRSTSGRNRSVSSARIDGGSDGRGPGLRLASLKRCLITRPVTFGNNLRASECTKGDGWLNRRCK